MCVFASFGAAALVALSATAQTLTPATTATSSLPAADSTPPKLPYGVDDVLKLSRAQVSEDVTLNFIRNSGTIYNLAPNDIVYMRNEGVSDRVINTMLDQRKTVPADIAAQSAQASVAAASQAPVAPDANAAAAAQAAPQYAPTYVQPAPVYVEPQPSYAPASTVYVIPYNGGGYGYANTYPYAYGGYYRSWGPSVVLGVGYGGGGRCGPYYYGGRYGGYHGGGHYRSYGRH
jgi:hypothetical protein